MSNLLEIRNLETYYGPVMAIRGVSMDVPCLLYTSDAADDAMNV